MELKDIYLGMTVYMPDPETGDACAFEVTAVHGNGMVELDDGYLTEPGELHANAQDAEDEAEFMLEDLMESAHYAAIGGGRFDMFDPSYGEF